MRIVLKFQLGTLLRSNTSRRERETEWQLRETRRKKYPSFFFTRAPGINLEFCSGNVAHFNKSARRH